jgi:DNA-binding CsgD family transcriptional regulator
VGPLDQTGSVGRGFRRLSLTLSVVGLAALASTFASIPSRGFLPTTYTALAASLLFFGSNLAFVVARYPQRWMAIVQAAEIAAIGLVSAIVSDPETYGGVILIAISVVLFAKHRVVRSRPAMVGVLAAAVVLDTIGSYLIHSAPFRLIVAMAGISLGVYAIIYFAFYDEIISLLNDVSTLRRTAEASEHNLIELRRDLARARIAHDSAREQVNVAEVKVHDLEHQVAGFEALATPVDVGAFGLSQREIDVLRMLVEIRGRNRDIGNALGITERTVKSHIYRICNKVGVDTRLELVELFRWNWPQGEPVVDDA